MSEIVIDFNRIKRSEMEALYADMEEIANAKTLDGFKIIEKWMARAIVSWPYKQDPGAIETYGDIGLEDYLGVIREFSARFRRLSSVDDRSADRRGANGKSRRVDVVSQPAAGKD